MKRKLIAKGRNEDWRWGGVREEWKDIHVHSYQKVCGNVLFEVEGEDSI